MSNHRSENHYDVIVIGAGAGGLAAAAWLAKAGKKVLLLEEQQQVGGLMASLAHGPYRFDVGARLLMGCNADGPYGPGPIHTFMEQIGARQQVEFLSLQPILEAHYPDSQFSIFSGRPQFIAGLNKAASHGLERLPELLDLCGRLYRESCAFSRSDMAWTPWNVLCMMPRMIRYANTNLDRVLSAYFPDRRARLVMGTLWPYLGIPPRQGSFLAWAYMLSAYVDEGAWYCRGSLSQVASAIAEAFQSAGGHLHLNCAARRVLVQNGGVTGVQTADGETYFAGQVIANIDPRLVFDRMLDPAAASGLYRRRLRRLTTSNVGLSLSFVTDLDLPGLGYRFENLFFDSWDENTVLRTPQNGQAGFFSLTVSSLTDPGVSLPGQHTVSAFTGLPAGESLAPENLQRYAGVLRQILERQMPGLADHLVLKGSAQAQDGYLIRSSPPVYGWESTPWQASLGRPELQTPLRGLLLAGHWTRPLHGVMSALLSGREAARTILRKKALHG